MARPQAVGDARSTTPGERTPPRASAAPGLVPETSGEESGAHGRDGRILFVAPQPFYEDRGSPIAVRRVLEALSALGQAVDLLTLPVGERLALPGLRILRVGTWLPVRHVKIGFSLRKLLLDCLLAVAVVQRLRQEAYRCIHAIEEAALIATIAGKLFKIPVVYDMHSSLPEQMAKHRLFRFKAVQQALHACERWMLRNAASVVCSAGLASYVRSVHPAAHVHEWLFPGAPVDSSARHANELRARHEIPASAPVVLYSGTFEAYQGLGLLIEAAAKVHARMPEVIFLLVGAPDGSGIDAAEALFVRLVRRRPQAEIAHYLALADILVSPRVHGRNLPLKIFDYMAAGKPIVATDCEPHRIVLDETRARLVRPEPEALADAIVDVLSDRALANRLARAARAHAETHCGFDRFTASIAGIYDRLPVQPAPENAGRAGAATEGGDLPRPAARDGDPPAPALAREPAKRGMFRLGAP